MKKTGFLAFLILLSGCATTAGYEQLLNSWVGATDRELIDVWGAPDSVYEFDPSQKVISYHREGSVYNPGLEPTYYATRVGNTITTTAVGGVPAQITHYACKTDFTLTDGKVTRWRWEGNNCRARKQKPEAAGSSEKTAKI